MFRGTQTVGGQQRGQPSGIAQQLVELAGDELLDFAGGNPEPTRTFTGSSDEWPRDVVAVALPGLDRMAWCHWLFIAIEQKAGEQARLARTLACYVLDRIARELGMHLLP